MRVPRLDFSCPKSSVLIADLPLQVLFREDELLVGVGVLGLLFVTEDTFDFFGTDFVDESDLVLGGGFSVARV